MAFLKSVLYVLFCGVASHFIGEALPRRWFHYDRAPFLPWKWEKNGAIYEKIRIQDWKDHMPDMSRVMKDMVPKRLGFCPTSEQVRILVVETCVAETVHVALCLVAPVIWLFWKNGMGVFLSGGSDRLQSSVYLDPALQPPDACGVCFASGGKRGEKTQCVCSFCQLTRAEGITPLPRRWRSSWRK